MSILEMLDRKIDRPIDNMPFLNQVIFQLLVNVIIIFIEFNHSYIPNNAFIANRNNNLLEVDALITHLFAIKENFERELNAHLSSTFINSYSQRN